MLHIEVKNINEAVAKAIPILLETGIYEESRNGTVIVAQTPVMTTYTKPTERVLFGDTRDANPYFHLMEALWMLAGRNDLAFPTYFNKNFKKYSDDNLHVHGAYGHRWRIWYGIDQLDLIVEELTKNPESRRAVLQMWSAPGDLVAITLTPENGAPVTIGGLGSKDVPCNTHAYFDLRGGVLNMTMCCRSNDAIYGAYGANVVHMSVLLEYMASRLGVAVGVYRQFSNNFHAYTDVFDVKTLYKIAEESSVSDFYAMGDAVTPYPLMSVEHGLWMEDLHNFMEDPAGATGFNDKFFSEVAQPMYKSWHARKEGHGSGLLELLDVKASDWRTACILWISRREARV